MMRIDMSEYMEKHSVARLIGAPPGYVGYDEGGALTEAVRRRPYQVILFDEVEKAHPDVFNVLLQVLDDGRLTDGQGRTVDFRNTLIVLTSNLGSEILATLPEGEEVDEPVRDEVMEMVRGAFRPEFLNRLDEILIFRRLTRDDMKGIVDIQLARLHKLLADRKITLALDDKARALARRGRLRSGLWRAAVEAGDPARAAEPAGRADPRGPHRRWRDRRCHRRRRRPRDRRPGRAGGGINGSSAGGRGARRALFAAQSACRRDAQLGRARRRARLPVVPRPGMAVARCLRAGPRAREAAMTRAELTEKIAVIKRKRGLSWKEIAAKIGPGSPVYYTAALQGR